VSDNLPDDNRQNGGAVAWLAIALFFFLLGCAIIASVTGCAQGIVYKPAPKPSTASEVDTYIKSAGGVARFLGLGADAK